MADVRGKFEVTRVATSEFFPGVADVTLEARYTGSAEDNTFAAATPTARIDMTITNPEAIKRLPIGKKFYVDFTAIDE
jgi:hypothetical protein